MPSGDVHDIPKLLETEGASPHKPLPPLPDGGLRSSMPAWLRPAPLTEGGATVEQAPITDPDLIDPRSFLSADDLPEWVRRLTAERDTQPPATSPSPSPNAERTPLAQRPVAFPRQFPRDRPALSTKAPRPTDDGRIDVNRPPSHSELAPAMGSGPNLFWPLLLFGVVTVVLIVAFFMF